jgi:hypothetical protein
MTDNSIIIDEAVEQLAKYFGEILTDDKYIDKGAEITKLFKSCSTYLKSVIADDDSIDDADNPSSNAPLLAKLGQMVAAMAAGDPTRSEQEHLFRLLNTARGRSIANHLNELSKGKPSMPQIDIMKLKNIDTVAEISKAIIKGSAACTEHEFTKMVQGHADLNRRSGESSASAFARIFTDPGNVELRRAHALTKSVNAMDVTPVFTEVGNTLVSDDSAKAYRQLQELAENNIGPSNRYFLIRPMAS